MHVLIQGMTRTSSVLGYLLDVKGAKYYGELDKMLERLSVEQQVSEVIRGYRSKTAGLNGLLFAYACEDMGTTPYGALGIGLTGISVSVHDDLTDKKLRNVAAYVNAGDVLLTEGFRIFVSECHNSPNFAEAFQVFAMHTKIMWECQQTDMQFFGRDNVSEEEYFSNLAKTREWAKTGILTAATLAGKEVKDYEAISNGLGNIIQLINDITDVEDDKASGFCTYFTCNIDRLGKEGTKNMAKEMIRRESEKIVGVMANNPSLHLFNKRLMELAEKI